VCLVLSAGGGCLVSALSRDGDSLTSQTEGGESFRGPGIKDICGDQLIEWLVRAPARLEIGLWRLGVLATLSFDLSKLPSTAISASRPTVDRHWIRTQILLAVVGDEQREYLNPLLFQRALHLVRTMDRRVLVDLATEWVLRRCESPELLLVEYRAELVQMIIEQVEQTSALSRDRRPAEIAEWFFVAMKRESVDQEQSFALGLMTQPDFWRMAKPDEIDLVLQTTGMDWTLVLNDLGAMSDPKRVQAVRRILSAHDVPSVLVAGIIHRDWFPAVLDLMERYRSLLGAERIEGLLRTLLQKDLKSRNLVENALFISRTDVRDQRRLRKFLAKPEMTLVFAQLFEQAILDMAGGGLSKRYAMHLSCVLGRRLWILYALCVEILWRERTYLSVAAGRPRDVEYFFWGGDLVGALHEYGCYRRLQESPKNLKAWYITYPEDFVFRWLHRVEGEALPERLAAFQRARKIYYTVS